MKEGEGERERRREGERTGGEGRNILGVEGVLAREAGLDDTSPLDGELVYLSSQDGGAAKYPVEVNLRTKVKKEEREGWGNKKEGRGGEGKECILWHQSRYPFGC